LVFENECTQLNEDDRSVIQGAAMHHDLPDHLKQSLNDSDYSVVLRWWNSLTAEERHQFSDISEFAENEHVVLPEVEIEDGDADIQPFYDYLVNHELRCVAYLDDNAAASSYKIVSHYVASLGSDLRHRRGTVG